MIEFHGHFSNPDDPEVDDKAFGIYVGERIIYGSPNIGCALNLWRFSMMDNTYRGNQISIRNKAGDILYSRYFY